MAQLRPGPGPTAPRVENGRPDTRGTHALPGSGSGSWAPPGGARARAEAALYRRRAPPLYGARARRSRGALPGGGLARRGRGHAGGGISPAGRLGMASGGGQLPGAAGEDVATAPRYPSAPATRPRRSLEPPSLRRSPPESGPHSSRPRCGPSRRPRQVSRRRRRRRWPGMGCSGEAGAGALLGRGCRPAVWSGAPSPCRTRPGALPRPARDGGAPASLGVSCGVVP